MSLVASCALLAGCDDGADGAGDAAPASGESTTTQTTASANPPDGDDDRDPTIPDIVRQVQPVVVAVAAGAGEGSGVIFDTDGIVVTNAHVVGDEGAVQLLYADGTVADAEVLGADPYLDLAVLRSERETDEAAEFADELPEVGERAVAIGNPLGFENTVTAGIISGLERSIPGGAPALVGLVQTDAPISPGNSGGALVGPTGAVVGINVAYLPPQAGAVSLGFAIPAPLVVDAVEQILETGAVDHAYLGLSPQTVTSQLAASLGLPVDSGVVVLAAPPGGPAAAAGIERGDVIVGLDGTQIETMEDLFAALREVSGGEVVTVEIVRDGDRLELPIETGRRPPA